jgi:hypothetical protein
VTNSLGAMLGLLVRVESGFCYSFVIWAIARSFSGWDASVGCNIFSLLFCGFDLYTSTMKYSTRPAWPRQTSFLP